MTKIKICGIQNSNDISYVNKYIPDYIGFVFAKSERKISDALAFQLKQDLSKKIKAVGVFVNEPPNHIISLCKDNVIDIVQLHGDEDETYIKELKKEISNPIIKAVRVKSTEQILDMQKLSCDYYLYDTFVKGKYGGSGLTFDRRLIPKESKPFFLAGGLNETNLLEAIKECSPYCVDLSSGVEDEKRKSEEKIKNVIELVRSI